MAHFLNYQAKIYGKHLTNLGVNNCTNFGLKLETLFSVNFNPSRLLQTPCAPSLTKSLSLSQFYLTDFLCSIVYLPST